MQWISYQTHFDHSGWVCYLNRIQTGFLVPTSCATFSKRFFAYKLKFVFRFKQNFTTPYELFKKSTTLGASSDVNSKQINVFARFF